MRLTSSKRNNANGIQKTNKYSILSDFEDDDMEEINEMANREIVDGYIIMKKQPKVTEMKDWTDDMKCYFKARIWNVRGMCSSTKQDEVINLIAEERLNVCVTLETHLRVINFIRINMGWNTSVVNIVVLHFARQSMLCILESVDNQFICFITLVYAANSGVDRSPTLLIFPKEVKKKKKPFKFANYITYKKEFLKTVEDGWKMEVTGFNMFVLSKKLKALKHPLNNLNWGNGNLGEKVKRLKAAVKKIQITIDNDPHNKSLRDEESMILKAYMEAVVDEEKLLFQKCKVKWLAYGDKNNYFFHKACNMVMDVTDKEVKDAMFGIDDNKAPGPDGFSAKFLKKVWSIMGKDVCNAIKEIFSSGKMLGELNATIISLVPKLPTPLKVSDFRPIACCNVVYKCISKILTCRIKGCLDKLVNSNQSAFILGRQIQDNILLAQELMKGYDRKEAKEGCLSLDITHICFADDLLVFSHGDSIYVKVIKDTLEEFGKCFGLLPNFNKSTIFFRGINGEDQQTLLNILPFTKGSLPVKYWSFVVLLPKTVVNDINKVLKSFLWGHGESSKGSAKVSWKIVCKPKTHGGLGLKDLAIWNRALLVIQKENTDCWGWMNLLDIRDMVVNHIKYKLGDGQGTFMWINKNGCVADMIENDGWKWPKEWYDTLPNITSIVVPILSNRDNTEKVRWKSLWGSFDMMVYALCKKNDESHDHLFFKCDFSKDLWTAVQQQMEFYVQDVEWNNIVSLMANNPYDGWKGNVVLKLWSWCVLGEIKLDLLQSFMMDECSVSFVLADLCFTPLTHNYENDTSEKKVDQNDEFSEADDVDKLKGNANGSISAGHFKVSEIPRTGGSMVGLLEDVIKVGQVMGFKMEGVIANLEELIGTQGGKEVIQETKMEKIEDFCVKQCWGNSVFDYVYSEAVGNSGGKWRLTGKNMMIIGVYAPQEGKEKQALWDFLRFEVDKWNGDVIIMGDFNEVRVKSDRFGTHFNPHGAHRFNSFILDSGLVEVNLGGCRFTWCHRSATKMSKLDRFLVSESVISGSPNIKAVTLERFLSDHRPILLKENGYDYGPTPFRFFHHWLEMDGFNTFVENTWKNSPMVGNNALLSLMNKLRNLKNQIRIWNKSNSGTRKNDQLRLKKQLEEIDLDIDRGLGNEELVNSRLAILHQIQKIDNLESKERAQKAKIKWAVEGDENSGFFHGIINKRRNIQNIRGVMVDGNWIENPNDVKKEFFDHFANRFGKPDKPTASISLDFPNQISHEQSDHMEREVSNDEIKKSVWECGTDKAPGPDGFTFGFFRHFWHLVDRDVCEAVRYFFKFSDLPKGCNSSFIALIPKIPDANLVKDFRPISLIGSIYKIIAKILTNRLVDVLGGIINEVQSAFIKDRQILDGPFILNEVMSWCKKKKKQTLLFKVDFEKAYDSVRWDFLDDVLGKFGFGDKWRKWIQCCLHSSKGSIIINGSPTDEFQFGRGLKQGDPLSPFLFLLIMESLHISFQRVVDAGMFHGIDVGGLVNLSHMFYADDAVFIGEWSESNITSLIHVLDCFHKVSGLKINMCKSKIMGIEVDNGKVSRAATKFGCLVLKAPFLYLGSYVGGDMNKIQSWKDIIDRIRRRLSRWKMKMLSIGGRLMLIKSVLGSMPIFHMSMFKVPAGVIQILESLRSKFFNGHESSGKKASWVQWKKALAPKDNGGLGIFSLYALNRGLIFKWVWRFLAHEPTLWSRVIKAIHGANGKIDEISGKGANSCWINIIKEVRRLEEKGINLLLFMKKKLGNGLSTLFWDDVWCDGGKLKNRFPRAYALENSKQITVGQKLAHPSLYHSFRRHPRGGLELTQVEELAKVINPVVLTQSPDSWSWTLNNSGGYTVASSRNMIDSRLLPKGDLKTRWIRYVPNKVNTFAWKVMTNSLPTRFNISRRGIDIESLSCVNCDVGIETNDHLFFACNTAKKISKLINRWWDVPFMDINSYGEWRSWIDNVKLPKKNKSMFQEPYSLQTLIAFDIHAQTFDNTSNFLEAAYFEAGIWHHMKQQHPLLKYLMKKRYYGECEKRGGYMEVTGFTPEVGTSLGATKGLLLRGGSILEKFDVVNSVILDKTGTLTIGKPVIDCNLRLNSDEKWSETDVLKLAATVESNTIHPIGKALLEAIEQPFTNDGGKAKEIAISISRNSNMQVEFPIEAPMKDNGIKQNSYMENGKTVIRLNTLHKYSDVEMAFNEDDPDAGTGRDKTAIEYLLTELQIWTDEKTMQSEFEKKAQIEELLARLKILISAYLREIAYMSRQEYNKSLSFCTKTLDIILLLEALPKR
ncbi:RNA-directed DNA polymerase, eukaryota [Tanacetum coccineum]